MENLPSPYAFCTALLVLCAQELLTLPQTISSVSHTLIYLWRAATISTARCHQLPRLTHTSATKAQYLATFRPFWRLFFPITSTYWQTKRLFWKNLSVRSDFPGTVSPLSASILSSERQKAMHSVGRTQQNYLSSINNLQTVFPSTCHLLTVWTFKYEHNLSVNMLIVCYSDAGSALNETKQ